MADELTKCREKIAELMEENATLREAKEDFGSLTERLHQALQQERRSERDRRITIRPTAERRRPLQGGDP